MTQGTVVPLTAAPATGSTFAGWTGDPDCADASVTMTGAKSCTATFTHVAIQPPQPGALCLPTQKQTFTPCVVPPNIETPPLQWWREGHDVDLGLDAELLYFGLGDSAGPLRAGRGNTVVWSYDASTNGWTSISTFCQAAAPSPRTSRATTGSWSTTRPGTGVWWLGQGDGFPPGQEGQALRRGARLAQGSIRRNGWMWLDPTTNTWTKTSEQATASTGGAVFDSQGDRAINIESENGYVTAHRGPDARREDAARHMVNVGPTPEVAGGHGGWNTAEYTNRVKFAWDDVNRIAYIPTIYRHYAPRRGCPG